MALLAAETERENFRQLAKALSGLVPAALGWTPDQFWNATPAELTAVFAAFDDNGPDCARAVPVDSKQLEKLKGRFPDAKFIG